MSVKTVCDKTYSEQAVYNVSYPGTATNLNKMFFAFEKYFWALLSVETKAWTLFVCSLSFA